MAEYKFKAEIYFIVDTDTYPTPADNRLSLSIREDMQTLIETQLPFEVTNCIIKKVGVNE